MSHLSKYMFFSWLELFLDIGGGAQMLYLNIFPEAFGEGFSFSFKCRVEHSRWPGFVALSKTNMEIHRLKTHCGGHLRLGLTSHLKDTFVIVKCMYTCPTFQNT